MCYNNCEHFKFNPMTGVGRCSLRKGMRCPEGIDYCKVCGKELPEEHESDMCEECEAEDICLMCHTCEEEFPDEGQHNCPSCGAHIHR